MPGRKRADSSRVPPDEIAALVEAIARYCPRPPEGRSLKLEDFDIRPANDSSGWYFRCTACGELRCVGFIPRKEVKQKQGSTV